MENNNNQDITTLLEKIDNLYLNADADKAISIRYITSFFYNYLFRRYRNEEVLLKFFKIYNDTDLQIRYLNFSKLLLKKYKKTSNKTYLDECIDIVCDIEMIQINRDLYFPHLQTYYDISLSNFDFLLSSDITNESDIYIKSIEEKIKRYK